MLKHKPLWLNRKIDYKKMRRTEEKLRGLKINTVCKQAMCPNISECFGRSTATFMILGNICTRNCGFCNVQNSIPQKPDENQHLMVLDGVKKLGLKYAVITSVTRDDLKDGGSKIFAGCVRAIKKFDWKIKAEVLVPDFEGDAKNVDIVLDAGPDMFAHNVETVPSLYKVRKGADYVRSLKVLEYAAKQGVKTKSALLLGLGEKETEVISVMKDLKNAGCDYLAIGQYLRPTQKNVPVKEYIHPDKFNLYKKTGNEMGFIHIESGPYVRSSYYADKYHKNTLKFELV